MKKKILSLIACMLLFTTTFVVAGTMTNTTKTDEPSSILFASADWWPQYAHDAAHTGFSTSTAPITNDTFIAKQLVVTTSAFHSLNAIVDAGLLYAGASNDILIPLTIRSFNAYSGVLSWVQGVAANPIIADNTIYAGNATSFLGLTLLGAKKFSLSCGGLDISPVSANGNVYFTTKTKKVYSVTSAGKENWNVSIPDTISASVPAVVNNKVYFSSSTNVYCLNASTGATVWIYPRSGSIYIPTVVNGKVYVASSTGMLCLDAVGTGGGTTTLLWSFPTGSTATDPAVAYGSVFFGSGATVYRVSADTGTEIWNYVAPATVKTPSVADDKVYLGAGKIVLCLPASGSPIQPIWQYQTSQNIARQPVIANGKVWVSCARDWLYGFGSNTPPTCTKPAGPTSGFIGEKQTFSTTATDPDVPAGDQVWYQWSFGGTESSWLGPFESGVEVQRDHTWTKGGTFEVRVRAKDYYKEGTWSDALIVEISKTILEIGAITSGLASISVDIKNSGANDVTNLEWNLEVTGGLFKLINKRANGTMSLNAGETKPVSISPIIGLGSFTVTFTAVAEETKEVAEEAEGSIFIIFISMK